MNNFDTQKVRIDLQADRQKAQQAYAQTPDLDTLKLIDWINRKLDFLASPEYRERKRQTAEAANPPVHFERAPDEGLL